jgi:hypothetical protein
MPVRKFRSVEAMGGPLWYQPGDPALYRAMRQVLGIAHRTLRPRFPPGVHRHASIEELHALELQWEDANFLAYRAWFEREIRRAPSR